MLRDYKILFSTYTNEKISTKTYNLTKHIKTVLQVKSMSCFFNSLFHTFQMCSVAFNFERVHAQVEQIKFILIICYFIIKILSWTYSVLFVGWDNRDSM